MLSGANEKFYLAVVELVESGDLRENLKMVWMDHLNHVHLDDFNNVENETIIDRFNDVQEAFKVIDKMSESEIRDLVTNIVGLYGDIHHEFILNPR